MTSRAEVLQRILELYDNPSYLEVGVYEGQTFFDVRAARKVAVDPKFQFKLDEADKACKYHEVTSDDYFGRLASKRDEFDVIFLDGLHTFEQILRDLINSLSFLKSDGVIVVDDILPNSYQASLADYEKFKAVKKHLNSQDASWMGDVYKLCFFIQTFFQQFSFATVQETKGQLVIWRSRRDSDRIVERTVGAIDQLDFADLTLQINQMNMLPLNEIVRSIAISLKSQSLDQVILP